MDKSTRQYPHVKMIRLRDEDLRRLETLAKRWGVSEAGVFRKALADAAKQEKIE